MQKLGLCAKVSRPAKKRISRVSDKNEPNPMPDSLPADVVRRIALRNEASTGCSNVRMTV